MSMIFLAVRDSSIGDLVTHWFPDWLLNSASSQSRAHTRCSLHPGTRLRFVMRSEFLTRMTRVTLRWEKWGTCRQWHCYQWNNDGKGFSYNEKNDKHEDNDIANDEILDDKGFLTVKKMTKMNYEDNDIANIKMRMRFPYIALSQDTKNMKVEVTFKTI